MKRFLIIILIMIVIILNIKNRENSENREKFDYGNKCLSCNNKSYHNCLNCESCGVCSTEFGDMYCTQGDINGPFERKDCYKWIYGNIYPQYYYKYYDESQLEFKNDARFYPYIKYIDDKNNTNNTNNTKFFSNKYYNNFYKQFNNTLKKESYIR